MIALILAKTSNGVIGSNNDLPWRLPADLKHFKDITSGHTVVMGRKTYESIYARLNSALPNRRNLVISRSLEAVPAGFELARSLEDALALSIDETVFIIGGAVVFEECLAKNLADTIYLTEIQADITGDTIFPQLDASVWREVSREAHHRDEKNPYDYDFVLLGRNT